MFEDNIDTLDSRSGIIIGPAPALSHLRKRVIHQSELISGSSELNNFSSVFAGLNLCAEMPPPNKPVEESPRCPCGCLQHGETGGFRTRELSSMRLVVHGPEILNYQGTRQAPEDVAPYWKKDSRMWLWKSVRLARRGKRNRMRLGTAFVDLN